MEANYQGLSTVTSIQPPVVNLHWWRTCKNVMSMTRTDIGQSILHASMSKWMVDALYFQVICISMITHESSLRLPNRFLCNPCYLNDSWQLCYTYEITTVIWLICRWHFQDFFHSILMVFRILCGEWVEPLWDCMRVTSEGVCTALFLMTLILGNFMVSYLLLWWVILSCGDLSSLLLIYLLLLWFIFSCGELSSQKILWPKYLHNKTFWVL